LNRNPFSACPFQGTWYKPTDGTFEPARPASDPRRFGGGEGSPRSPSRPLLLFFLLVALPPSAATDDGKVATYEDRATAEKMSRSRYRGLEVASLVVILVAGGLPSSGRPQEETVT